jgi:hypothetical protein
VKGLAVLRRRLRDRSEYYLRLAAMEELRRDHPRGTKPSAPPPGGLLWRRLFVPLYRRVSWEHKTRAMRALRMTASGWEPPARRPGEPWRPPAAR